MDKLPENTNYCRKCTKILPEGHFYDASDGGFIDTNKKLSVCKECIIKLYDESYEQTQSMEKTLHKLCISLNIKYFNEAVDATRAHITTLIDSGKNVRSIFGIYKTKLLATQKSMDKNALADMSYEDVGVIFEEREIEIDEIPIPEEVRAFWGKDLANSDIHFLEEEYKNFRTTHKADTYAQVVLLKQVCYTMLEIKKQRKSDEGNTDKLVKELQSLMSNLAIAPKDVKSTGTNKGEEAFGLWIADIERSEPAQWLTSDPRGDAYRDVANVDKYFKEYIVRPLRNFILQSRDFNVNEDEDNEKDLFYDDEERTVFIPFDDGE